MERFFRHEDILTELRIVRRHEAKGLAALEGTDDFLVGAFEDADNLALARTAFFCSRRHAGDDAVAMHRRIEVGARYEYIRFFFKITHIRNDEAKTFGRHRQASDHEVHTARDAVEVAAVLDDGAFFFKLLESCAELYELFRRQLHAFSQVLGQKRAICLFMHIR